MVTILGPTATGKTRLAALVAARMDGEVISADSRQVYRGMNIGTGKDYDDYLVEGKHVPHHLVDMAEPSYEYSVFEFQRDFLKSFDDIVARDKLPVLCGGTGLYLEAALSGKQLIEVPEDILLRVQLELESNEKLNELLQSLRKTHNTTDLTDRKRTIRAIEIAIYERENPDIRLHFPEINHLIFGIHFERDIIRQRITERLKKRLDAGMIDEVNLLLASGLKPEQLTFYGLEYRYLTDYVTGKISFDEMFHLLNIAIHQFAKRQMTWFRRMEKKGISIEWIDGYLPDNEKTNTIERHFKNRFDSNLPK
ncbi:MAG: tRNA (adenosine(37)-N6)-dimethylallyltransferase MiaA [Bacteroidales bacterium]|nr:tRNA (adenosine(37)-N6)-dimethylallyltransferase MiaA [Bacteroidales bacterium]